MTSTFLLGLKSLTSEVPNAGLAMIPPQPKCCDNKSWPNVIEISYDGQKGLRAALGRVICCSRDDVSLEPSECHIPLVALVAHTRTHYVVCSTSQSTVVSYAIGHSDAWETPEAVFSPALWSPTPHHPKPYHHTPSYPAPPPSPKAIPCPSTLASSPASGSPSIAGHRSSVARRLSRHPLMVMVRRWRELCPNVPGHDCPWGWDGYWVYPNNPNRGHTWPPRVHLDP